MFPHKNVTVFTIFFFVKRCKKLMHARTAYKLENCTYAQKIACGNCGKKLRILTVLPAKGVIVVW